MMNSCPRVDKRSIAAPPVVCAVLPFSQLSPALDASTLATVFRGMGIPAKVIYPNRLFAADTGEVLYDFIAAGTSLNSLLGDWVFRDAVFGDMDNQGYLKNLLDRQYISARQIPSLLNARKIVPSFLDQCLEWLDWSEVQVLCLVDTYAKRDAVSGQLMASLALAKALKHKYPKIKVVLAGPNTEEEMGRALSNLHYLDYVCIRDIYQELPSVVLNFIGESRYVNVDKDSGLYAPRKEEQSRILDLPIPEFDDWFELAGDGLPGSFNTIPMEGSKGCWWAEKKHCLFCALPGSSVTFRSKTPERFLKEFFTQIERYRPERVEMTDLIIDQSYFCEVFPAINKDQHRAEIFFETKAHLKKDKIEMLSKAGVRTLQAGIETLSAATLARFGKGVAASQNLSFLHDCHQAGILCYWNYLHSFPGETAEEMLEALPVIRAAASLQPPATFQPVRVERFSPYFREPEKHGIARIFPDRAYGYLLHESGVDVEEFAFHHEHEEFGVNVLARTRAIAKLRSALDKWQDENQRSSPVINIF